MRLINRLFLLTLSLSCACLGAIGQIPAYHLEGKFSIPGEGGWDYISVDSQAGRIYVSHGTRLEVLDSSSGKVLGEILDTPGVHGVAIAPELERGFTSNGGDKSVVIFNTGTLRTIKKISVNRPDFILYDSFSKRVFPLNQKITVLEATTGETAGEVDLGGDPEAGVSDGKGLLYINLADKSALAVVDSQSLKVTKTFPIEHCTSPHSLAFDTQNQRLFVGCRDGLAVLDASSGKVVARSMICSGVDAGAFDPDSKLIFESCGEGVISVIKQVTPDFYELADTIKTELLAKTMSFDQKSKKIYLPTAEFEDLPNSDPKLPYPVKRQMVPNSFHVLILSR